jgi:hypothetical protein
MPIYMNYNSGAIPGDVTADGWVDRRFRRP